MGRLTRHEVAGGLGDSGLFIPIAVALITINGLQATAVFGIAGLAYIGTAAYFRVPVPVQPLKAFAAAAIALHLSADVLAAGALLMAAAMGLLALTGAAGWIAERFPLVLIRGIQASVALLLLKAAVELAKRGNWSGLPSVEPWISAAVALATCTLLFFGRKERRLPGTLIVLAGGLIAGTAISGFPTGLHVGPGPVSIGVPGGASFATALSTLVLAQIPLTFGNAVVATADAERDYFGARAGRVRPNRLAASIGVWNSLAGLASGLPVCHGAGGVTAHYRLGARTATATMFTGALYLTLALVLGNSLPEVLTRILPGALAGMLLFVAVQHGLLAARLERLDDRLIAAGVGMVTLLSGNLAIGFGAGVAVVLLRHLALSRLPSDRGLAGA
jgi:sulfate permease, SulP family